jgi:3-oxoadipate enol-lactonase
VGVTIFPENTRSELEINGTRVSYWMEGSGEPLLLLHGYACTSQDWSAVGRMLSDRWRVIGYDFPGHGFSGGHAPLSLNDLLHCTAAVISELCDSPPVLIGHSMGGMVATAYAVQGTLPLRGLVLAEAFPHLGSVIDVFGGAEDPNDPFGYGSVIDRQTPSQVEQYVRTEMGKGAERAGEELFETLIEFDARGALEEITCPTMLILGNRRWVDIQLLPSLLKRLGYIGIPLFRVRLIDSHHFIMLEKPHDVAHTVRSFLEELQT